MAKCKSCGADIIFLGSKNGKPIPCNAEQTMYWARKGAKGRVVTPNGEVISCVFDGDLNAATGIGYIPHWATCPGANQFRKKEDKTK